MLALTALEQGVDLMLETDPAALAYKAQGLSALFIETVEAACSGLGLTLVSPRAFADRGSHVSFAHPHAYAVCQALIDRGVIGDFRTPDVLRFGFTPLYTRYAEVWAASQALAQVLATRAWDRPGYQARGRVT